MHNPKHGYCVSDLKLKPQILLLALFPETSQTKPIPNWEISLNLIYNRDLGNMGNLGYQEGQEKGK